MKKNIPDFLICKETLNCDGFLKKFCYMKQDDNESAQYKCNKCNLYVRFLNGEFYSTGKYNNALDRGLS